MSANRITDCPECKMDSLRRIISGGTGLIFKGSGYYLTDYKDKKTKKDYLISHKDRASRSYTTVLFDIVKDRLGINIIGFFLMEFMKSVIKEGYLIDKPIFVRSSV